MSENKNDQNKQNGKENTLSNFEKEIARLPPEIKSKLESKKNIFSQITEFVNKNSQEKSMGFFITPKITVNNGVPTPDFDNLTINFLLDDFEKPVQVFNARFLFGNDFDKYLIEEKKKNEYGDEEINYILKADKSIKFVGTTISILRENCFDGMYDELKSIGSSFIYSDERGFISALKTIDIHRNMLLQKFEKYVVVYAGAGSWLRGEKSNDFDVFIVIDDTDVKRMPRMQVKDQLTKIIWQMSHEVAALTGIQIHIQVYLLTDFWDALKDAHPVMFTFLRDGVPFYDRGIYSAWKELLKLGKIRPSPEAIDMHMNVGTQLLERAKKTFKEIAMQDIYNAVLSPSQAILMLKGYNPTTPKETVKMFKEVLLAKEKSISKFDVETLEKSVAMFKELEHDDKKLISGTVLDKMLKDADSFLKNIKKMFEIITEERTKESIVTSYNELLVQIRTFPNYNDLNEDVLINSFKSDYIDSGKLPGFVKGSLKNVLKAKLDYDNGKITVTEVNKVLKELRLVLAEIKNYRNRNILDVASSKKLELTCDNNKSVEILNFENVIYLIDISSNNVYELKESNFIKSKVKKEDLIDSTKLKSLDLDGNILDKAKEILKTKKLSL